MTTFHLHKKNKIKKRNMSELRPRKMIKAKSDISFKEYHQKICQSTCIKSDYGFYYDIESNKWIRPCALCDCIECVSKDMAIKKKKIDDQMIEKHNRFVMNVINTLFVGTTFLAALTILYKFA
jgi:hypothetical protein